MQVLYLQGLLLKDDLVRQVQQREQVDEDVLVDEELLEELVEVELVVLEIRELLEGERGDRSWAATGHWLPRSRLCTLPCCHGPLSWLLAASGAPGGPSGRCLSCGEGLSGRGVGRMLV